jgi:hypothetical protein
MLKAISLEILPPNLFAPRAQLFSGYAGFFVIVKYKIYFVFIQPVYCRFYHVAIFDAVDRHKEFIDLLKDKNGYGREAHRSPISFKRSSSSSGSLGRFARVMSPSRETNTKPGASGKLKEAATFERLPIR